MEYSLLGRSGIKVSKISLGTATFGASPQEPDAQRLVHRALDLGVNFFDTANSYGVGPRWDRPGAPPADQRRSAEEILGDALKGRRYDAIIATKVAETLRPQPNWSGLSRRHIFHQVDESLRRLNTDYIDIYYAHRPDPNTHIEETLAAFDDLIRLGKIRYYALSNFPAWKVIDALWASREHHLHPPVCVQALYNLTSRQVEAELLPAIASRSLSLVAYSPLAGGLLSGREVLERSIAGKQRWGGPAFDERQRAQCLRFDAISKDVGIPASQLALAWLQAQPGVASMIVGSERIESLEESCASTEIVLSPEILAALDEIGSITG